MQTEIMPSQIQKVCSSTYLNLLAKIHQYIVENLGSTLSEFSGQWNLSLNMAFSLNSPEISTTDYTSASHTWNRTPCESQKN